MIFPTSIFLYSVMGLLAGIVVLNTFITFKNTGSLSFKNFSLFFFFVSLFLICTAFFVYLSLFLNPSLITSGLIGIRLFVFIAIFYLLQTLFSQSTYSAMFSRYSAILIICVFTASTILQIVYFQAVTITADGIIIHNMDRIAAWLIGLTSLGVAFTWSFRQLLFLLRETDQDNLLKVKVFMFFIILVCV